MSAAHNKPSSKAQENVRAMWVFAEAEPDWMARGLMVTNAWGREEGILQHLIALAIKDAYERGYQGNQLAPIPAPPPVQKMFKRSVHTPAPPPEPEIVLPVLSPALTVALRQVGYDPTTRIAADVRLRLRTKGFKYQEIEDAVLHWEAGK